MTDGLPKSARDMLARQAAGDAHPSADLLNGYAERALSTAESERVAGHLACCKQCREILFLATGVEQETALPVPQAASPLPPSPQWAALGNPRSVGRTAAPPHSLGVPPDVPGPAKEKKQGGWRWAAPVAVVLVIAAAALLERDRIAALFVPPQIETARVQEQPAVNPQPQPAAAPEVATKPTPQSSEVSTDHPAVEKKTPPTAVANAKESRQILRATPAAKEAQPQLPLTAGKLEPSGGNELTYSGRLPAKPAPLNSINSSARQSATNNVEVTSAAPLVQADNADLSTNFSQNSQAQSLTKSLTGNNQQGALTNLELARRAMQNRAQWRISSGGHLEHATGPDNWARILASEPVTFRVVATVAGNVWAGGSGGELFRSSDDGEHWNRVLLTSDGQAEHGSIVAINFHTSQQGTVTTEAGTTWTTFDGGRSWSKQ